MIKSRKVQLPSIAEAMKMDGESIQVKSIHHRLEDFFREVILDYEKLAILLVCCLGLKGKLRLCIDRTEWDFGKYQVNILMMTISNGQVTIPLYWELLENKSGNSKSEDRIGLVEKVVNLIGLERIGIIIADREFIGHRWLKYLKDKGIHFCVRVPKHHLIERLDGSKQLAEDLAREQALYLKDCLVDGVWVNVYLKKLKDGELLFLIGTMADPKHLGQVYRKRWTIEATFQSFKSRGFDLESSHLKHKDKLKKLVGMVALAYAFCVSLGLYQDKKVQKIKIKNHGYKTYSYCRVGIDFIKDLCKQPFEVFDKTIQKFIRFLAIQRIRYLKIKTNTSLSVT